MKKTISLLIFFAFIFSCQKESISIEGSWTIDEVEYLNPESNLFNYAFISEGKITNLKISDGEIFSLNNKGEIVEQNSYKLTDNSLFLDGDNKEFSYSMSSDNNLILNFKDLKLNLSRK